MRSREGVVFLLWKSFQDGIHLLSNGCQCELKLILQTDKKEKES